MDSESYKAFVRMVAENTLRMEESPRTAAQHVVIATETVGDEMAIRFSAAPFVDDPKTDVRLFPKDVIKGTSRDLKAHHPEDLREMAVELIKQDIYQAMMEIENDTVIQKRRMH